MCRKRVKGRRGFLMLSASAPWLLLTKESEAFFPALIFRFFARKLISKFIKRGVKKVVRNVVVKNVKKRGRARVTVTKAIQIHSRVNHLIDAHKYLSNQVWNRNKSNHSTLVISNHSNRSVNTKKVTLKMKDRRRGKTEFKAKVKPLRIPPKSTVVVDLKVRKIRRTGIKKLHVSNKRVSSSSGNVLVLNKTKGLTVEELYRRYYQQERGGKSYELNNKLNSNIIL